VATAADSRPWYRQFYRKREGGAGGRESEGGGGVEV